MDREHRSPSDVLPSRPNGRSASGLVVSKEGRRPLFGRSSSKENDASPNDHKPPSSNRAHGTMSLAGGRLAGGLTRPTSSDSSIPSPVRNIISKPQPTPETRIPAPKTSTGQSRPRRPFTLMDGLRIAEQEEARRQSSPVRGDISPSPAPRPWLSRHESDKDSMRRMLDRSPVESKINRGFLSRRSTESMSGDDPRKSMDSSRSTHSRSGSSLSELERKVHQAAEERDKRGESFGRKIKDEEDSAVPAAGREGAGGGIRGLFGSSRIGPKIAETGKTLAHKASSGSLDDRRQDQPRRVSPLPGARKEPSLDRFLSIALREEAAALASDRHPAQLDQDIPIPSIENGHTPLEPTPPTSRPASANPPNLSPNKSYAWNADAEFTAGDLEVSDSPRIRVNDKLEQIRRRELELGLDKTDSSLDFDDSDLVRIEDARDVQTARRSFNRSPSSKLGDIRARELDAEATAQAPRQSYSEAPNRKLDEIRRREIESLSKKAIATSRLDEIRELNSSFDSERHSSYESARETTPGLDSETAAAVSAMSRLDEGERIPNTPVTIFKKTTMDNASDGASSKNSRSSSSSRPSLPVTGDEPRDLLRSLARMASISPAAESAGQAVDSGKSSEREVREDSAKKSAESRQGSSEAQKPSRSESRHSDRLKPSVGFAGLRRMRSTDSAKDKRSSMALSEDDPVDRIEQEMKLFAPMENQSERGSTRAPSPTLDSDEDDQLDIVQETPRPLKKDPLTLPTPKVTGAYVETPAALRVGNFEVAEEKPEPRVTSTTREKSRSASTGRERKPSTETRSLKVEGSSSESDLRRDRDAAATTISSTVRRRARSLPKRRGPLINTARPPTVKDDLLEISRTHNIEDSTLDDFGDIFAAKRSVSPDIEAILRDVATKSEDELGERERQGREKTDREKELETYNRMSKSLKTGLMGIRTAKQGIERLEDKVAHSESIGHKQRYDHVHDSDNCPTCTGHAPQSAVSYVQLPLPRLYSRQPNFRLTFLGLLCFVTSLWYMSESAMCGMYCRPEACVAGTPCVWSADDPTWGWALPVKADQWITGGAGRKYVAHLAEEVDDYVADVWDGIMGIDIKDVDVNTLSFEQKRQHRRRLQKKGLVKPRVESAEDRAKWDAWRKARLAKERAKVAREMGYDVDDGDESFSSDERV